MAKKILLISLAVVVIIIGGIGIYAFQLYQNVSETAENIYEPLERGDSSAKRPEPVNIEENKEEDLDPISVLLLGVDARSGNRGRSDTIIVMTINPLEESTLMFSIPRDTRTEIIGRGFQDKINHAYAFGGMDMAVDTVENFLDIPIDYVAQVNLNGFVSVIDILDGVTVHVDQTFDYSGHSFQEGPMEMDGEAALAYSRMRYDDPRGDLGRNDRQQHVIQALLREAASYRTITRVDDILDEVSNEVRTNMSMEEMNSLRKHYIEAAGNQERLEITGHGQRIDGIYYYIVEEEERARIQNKLKEHLQLTSTSENQ